MNKEIKKEFSNFDNYIGFNVEYYKSSAPKNTSIYFTNDDDKHDAKNYFDFLSFEYKVGKNQYFLKYPGTDYFVALHGGLMSAHGNMNSIKLEDIWKDDYYKKISIYKHSPHLLLKRDAVSSFNFMDLKSRFVKDGDDFLYKGDENTPNYHPEIVQDILKNSKFLMLPNDVRSISYMVQTDGIQPAYLVIDNPAYNFLYDNTRLRLIKNNEIIECKITNFKRYKDGGTTYIDFIDNNGKEYIFFYPTSFNQDPDIFAKLDDKKVIDVDQIMRKKLIEFLNIIEKNNE